MFASKSAGRGAGLVELLTALAVSSVLLLYGSQGWSALVRDSQRVASSNGFLADLALARSESIRRGKRVVLCTSADGQSCATAGNWQQGRIVFVDTNNNAQREPHEALISVVERGPEPWVIKGNTHVSRYVSYHPLGRSMLISGAFQAGTVTICLTSSVKVRASEIVISSSGRPRVQQADIPSCSG